MRILLFCLLVLVHYSVFGELSTGKEAQTDESNADIEAQNMDSSIKVDAGN